MHSGPFLHLCLQRAMVYKALQTAETFPPIFKIY